MYGRHPSNYFLMFAEFDLRVLKQLTKRHSNVRMVCHINDQVSNLLQMSLNLFVSAAVYGASEIAKKIARSINRTEVQLGDRLFSELNIITWKKSRIAQRVILQTIKRFLCKQNGIAAGWRVIPTRFIHL